MDRIVKTFTTILSLQVCAEEDVTKEEIEAWANTHHHPGTSNGWKLKPEGAIFPDGTPQPNPCADYKGRFHWLLTC